jgi:hypothetical protein
MASAKARHKVGLGLLGSGVVGEAIQDIVFNDLKGQVGSDLQLEIRKIYTRRPKEKSGFPAALPSSQRKRGGHRRSGCGHRR